MRLNLDNYIKSGKLTAIDANNSDKVVSNASSTVIHAVESLSEYKLLHKNAEYVIVKDDGEG